MNRYSKKLAAAGLCVCMAFGVAACGNDALDGKQIAAQIGETEVTLGEANFLLRYQQAQYGSMYQGMINTDFYNRDMSETTGTKETFGDTMKEGVMSGLQDSYILQAKAADFGVELTKEDEEAISQAADRFLKSNDSYANDQMTADKETLEKVLTLDTYSLKVREAILKAANVTVTDEEAAQRGFRFVKAEKTMQDEESGEKKELSADEIAAAKASLEEMAAVAAGGTDFEMAAQVKEFTVEKGSYSDDNPSSYPTEVINALDALAEGEMSGVVETDDAMYLLEVTAELDEEATEARKAALKSQRESQYFSDLMSGWREEYPLEVKEDVWKQVVFDRNYALMQQKSE